MICATLQGDSLQQVIAAMVPTQAKPYPSAFDLRELREDLALKDASEAIQADTINL